MVLTMFMRVRFAPSPTGALHIGGARTALYNWLLATGQGGTFVLRIEDTDRERSTPENVEQILDALQWLKPRLRRGPDLPDAARQSATARRSRSCSTDGHAYHSNATADDVKAYKERHGSERGFRGEPEESGAVRLRYPDTGDTVLDDVIRGEIRFPNSTRDDPVIARADGSVLYNFAVAVDDLDAGITDVVRGEDHISNTPTQLLVFEALGQPRRATRTCRCCTDPTAASCQSATARHRSRSCAPPATCPRRSTTTSRCSAPGSQLTRSTSRWTSWPSASGSSECPRTRRCSTSRSCAT